MTLPTCTALHRLIAVAALATLAACSTGGRPSGVHGIGVTQGCTGGSAYLGGSGDWTRCTSQSQRPW